MRGSKAQQGPDSSVHTRDPAVVLEAERDRIGKPPEVGLAISGGGIRSASFGLGVLQALVRGKQLEKVDYLSTVSGGGYIGTSLTWFLSHLESRATPPKYKYGTKPENFPFGTPAGEETKQRRNAILDFIRQHGKYLTPGQGLNTMALLGRVMRSMFISLFIYLAMLSGAFVSLRLEFWRLPAWIESIMHGIASIVPWGFSVPEETSLLELFIPAALLILLLLIASNLLFSLGTPRVGEKRYARSITGQKILGVAWTLIIGLLLVGLLPFVEAELGAVRTKVAAGGFTLLGSILGFFEFRTTATAETVKDGLLSRMGSELRILVGAAAVIYGLLLLAYLAAGWFLDQDQLYWILVLAAATLLFGLLANLNRSGLHHMYRDRLMETFLPNAESVEKNQWDKATKADPAKLEDMCTGANARPYQLINTNVILVDSPTTKFRGRGGDSFLLSPLYCGSNATGWRPTSDYMQGGGYRGMTLATAMAISGAAVNPNTGAAGRGVTRTRVVAALFSLLNLRLGHWGPSPIVKKPLSSPNYFIPGLESILAIGHTERPLFWGSNSRRIELSDGGHFENLGLYELIRRRLSLIMVSDAGADPDFRFGDLANAVEKVRVDFGVKIRFREDWNIDGLLPGSAKGDLAEKYELAERGYAVADIFYADGAKGTLVYLKSTLTDALPADVYGYKSANESFPDQSTADQFFDEAQFEAYRELGYQLTKQMLHSPVGKQLLPAGQWDGTR